MDKLGSIAHRERLTLWISRIRDCRSSGMTVAKWCAEQNVGTKSYYYWLRKIRLEALETYESLPALTPRTEATSTVAPAFAEVNLLSGTTGTETAAIVLDVNGAKLQIHNTATQTTIVNTLAAIRMITSEGSQC